MILTDSSVWINHINHAVNGPVERLRSLIPSGPLLMGDLILCEILRGFRSEAQARLTARALGRFQTVSLCSPELAMTAAANYRFLHSRGITIRKTIDVIIGTFCIERGHHLLHSDRDFEPMERLLGLRTI
jgi:predicted nucleic acid-binding protein